MFFCFFLFHEGFSYYFPQSLKIIVLRSFQFCHKTEYVMLFLYNQTIAVLINLTTKIFSNFHIISVKIVKYIYLYGPETPNNANAQYYFILVYDNIIKFFMRDYFLSIFKMKIFTMIYN